jgi:hypothetical protein
MKIYNKILGGGLLLSMLFGNVQCTKAPVCNEAIIDLSVQLAIAAGTTLVAGVPFNAVTIIPCAINTAAKCEGEIRTAVASIGKVSTSKKQSSGQYAWTLLEYFC